MDSPCRTILESILHIFLFLVKSKDVRDLCGIKTSLISFRFIIAVSLLQRNDQDYFY